MLKRITLLWSFISLCTVPLLAQSTAESVYQIFQTNCATPACHSNATQIGGLDLEGAGANLPAQMSELYNRVYQGTPANSYAANEGYELIAPGRADKSFIFRKINEGLEPTITLDPLEEGPTPHGDAGLTNKDKEILRQWILYGAPAAGVVANEQLIDDYYNIGGEQSFPNGPPPAPHPSEGFQIKMGPFFLEAIPNYNIELYQKYELDIPQSTEVTRIETLMGAYSHHFILYQFNNQSSAASVQHGLRTTGEHFDVKLVEAVQQPTDLNLPHGSAFFWPQNPVLDLNTHYINYTGIPYAAEVYLNIYTQPSGTANQEMKTELFVDPSICIPPNGNEIAFEQTLNYSMGDIFIWGLTGHTHQLGTGYKVWKREQGVKTDLIYDASCFQGIPGCASPVFDYQHIPFMYADPFIPVNMSWFNGIVHEATYLNDGNQTVCWGPTSQDEMMVLIMMYLEDTTGVGFPTAIEDVLPAWDGISVTPNPMTDRTIIELGETIPELQLTLYDLLGRPVYTTNEQYVDQITVERNNLPAGIYVYQLSDGIGRTTSGRLVME